MKMIYEAPLFPGVGGGPRHFEGIASSMADLGVETHIVLPSKTAVNTPSNVSKVTRLRSPGNRALRHLTYEVSRIALLVRLLASRQRVDVWMSRHSLFGVGTLLARRVANVVVLEVNGPVREEVLANFGSRALAVLVDRIFRWQIRCADVTIAVSPGLVEYVRERVPSADCRAVPNGSFDLSADTGVGHPNPRHSGTQSIVYSGALTPWYDLETVFLAIGRLRDIWGAASMVVVGDGNQLTDLQRFVAQRGLQDAVKFTGWLPPGESQRYVQSATVGVIPMGTAAVGRSPLKLYEYAAAGLAIVGSDVDGVSNSPLASDICVYEVGDVEGCADALHRAISHGRKIYPPEAWSWKARAASILSLVAQRQ